MSTLESTVAIASEVLAMRFGGTPELTSAELLAGSGNATVVRCRVSPNPFLQVRSVVVKLLPPDPAGEVSELGFGENQMTLIREVVAYQYTNTLPEHERPGPLLLAYDVDQRVLILSDEGDGASFTEVMNYYDDDARRTAVRKLGRALGRMHSHTFGDVEAFRILYRRQCQRHQLNPSKLEEYDIDIPQLIRRGMDLMTANDVAVDPVVAELAERAAQSQASPNAQAFTPFDLAPDNIMLTKNVVFLDYEWAKFRDITFDVACVIAGFPQDNATPALSDVEASEFLATWRAEIAPQWPEIHDNEVLRVAILSALIGWAFMSLMMLYYGRLALDENPGAVKNRQDLQELTHEQLEDLSTTVDAIQRFAKNQPTQYTDAVTEYTAKLQSVLKKMGASPKKATALATNDG